MNINSNYPRTAAFTLIEIMVVVVILGILAATIIPQFMGTTQDAKISAAKSQVAELESALERFNLHMDRYPTTEEGLQVLVTAPAGDEQKWRGPYVKKLRVDPWGNPFQYACPGIIVGMTSPAIAFSAFPSRWSAARFASQKSLSASRRVFGIC